MTITCFLGLDGVLHPAGSYIDMNGRARVLRMGSAPFEFAQRIAKVAELSVLEFVICSPWLQKMTLLQLREQAPPWMRPRIVGICAPFADFDDIQRVHRHASTWSAVDSYVRTYGIKNWFAVDCSDDGWPSDVETRERLVLCDPPTGLANEQALTDFTEALRRESRLAGAHYSATLVVSLHDESLLAVQVVQERWHLEFWLQCSDHGFSVRAVFSDEHLGPPRTVVLDAHDRHEDLKKLALRAMCAAGFDTPASAIEWWPHYRWNRVAFAVQSVGPLPIGQSCLRLAVELFEDESRVTYRHEDGWVESYWQPRTEEDSAPLALLTRTLTTVLARAPPGLLNGVNVEQD